MSRDFLPTRIEHAHCLPLQFRFATRVDALLNVVGIACACVAGVAVPLQYPLVGEIFDELIITDITVENGTSIARRVGLVAT